MKSKRIETELFEDVPVLRRKWQAALPPGEKLPRYEDVMLGSLGRLADHIVLLKHNRDALEVSRTGRYAQRWLNDERWDIPLSSLSPDCATALGEASANALANGRPHLALAHCVRDGMVRTYDVLALPTSSRWGGTLVGTYVNERAGQYNLLDAVFANTEEGCSRSQPCATSSRSRSTSRSCITIRLRLRSCKCRRKPCNGGASAKAATFFARAMSSTGSCKSSRAAVATSSRSTAASAACNSARPPSATCSRSRLPTSPR
jgi:hypothetical protein